MEGVNSFEKGLHRSNSPQEQPEGSYVDALNWIRNDSGRLINEELEEQILPLLPGYKLLGYTPVNDLFICLFQVNGTESEIGTFKKGVYNGVYRDTTYNLKLNFQKEIDCVARVNSKGDIVVYFVEEDNAIRRFNLNAPTEYTTLDDFELQLSFDIPVVDQVTIDNDGNLPTGVYSIVLRYRTAQNNASYFGIPTRFYSIAKGTVLTLDNYEGGDPQSTSSKSIKFTPTHLDPNYPYIEPVIITYEGITSVLVARSLGVYANAPGQIVFSDVSQYQDVVDVGLISQNPLFYTSAKSIEQKDNILVLSNLTTKKYDRQFQQIANNIKVLVKPITYSHTKNFDISNIRTKNDSGYYGRYVDAIDERHNVDTISQETNSPYRDPLIKKGFKRGERYSLSITPIYKDGSIGFAYHIPSYPQTTINGLLTTIEWPSAQEYPDYIRKDFPNLGKNIKHHQIPDVNTYPLYNGNNITVLQLELTNINFGNQAQFIQGYIIGYQARNSPANTHIVTEGINRPYMRNGNLKKMPFFNGASKFIFASNVGMEYEPQPPDPADTDGKIAFNFFSPDFIHGKDVYGNKFQKLGYCNGTYYLTYGAVDSSGSQLAGAHITTAPFNFIYQGGTAVNISNIIEVPQTSTTSFVSTKYEVTGTKGYTHIELQNGIYDTFSEFNSSPFYFKLSEQTFVGITTSNKTYKGPIQSGLNLSICRLINSAEFQYGRLENADYAILETSVDLNTSSIVIEGDTYVQRYFYDIYDRINNNIDAPVKLNPGTDSPTEFRMLAGLFIESTNNYTLKHNNEDEVPYYPKEKILYRTSVPPLGLFNIDYTNGYSNGYNKQYSAINNTKVTVSTPLLFDEVVNFPNRSVYSEQSFESELTDQYRIIPPNNFHDIPKDRGPITDTFVFGNNFFHHTEFCLWQSFFNPNTVQSTSQGDIVLGNAGIFRIPSKPIIDIKGGYMGTLDKSGTNTPFGRVFLDHYQGKIFLFAGEAPVEISDLGLFSFFREFVNTTDKYSMGYDWANKRLLISRIGNKAISFYPKTQTWTSLHDFAPTAYLTLNGASYAWQDNNTSFYNLDNLSGTRKEANITFVENTAPDAFKRFDRIEMNTMSGGVGGIFSPGSVLDTNSYKFIDKSFTHIHCWTDRQNSTELQFDYPQDYDTAFNSSYNFNLVPVSYYRSSFHAELPLDAVIDPTYNIFGDSTRPNNNLDINADFRAHMKGKFLYTKLSYKDSKPLVLNYVKTYFRPSVA